MKLVATLAALALVAAACSDEQASGPGTDALPPATADTTTSSTTTTPTTVPPTDAPTTTAAETTTTAAPTTTAVPTTTTPPPTGQPVGSAVPLFAGGGTAGGWLHLGEWSGTGWTAADAVDGEAFTVGAPVRVTSLSTPHIDAVLGGAAETCFDDRVGPAIDVDVAPPEPPGFGYGHVAVGGDWPLAPRPVVPIDAEIPAYQAAGEALFADSPIDPSLGDVVQIVLADLDGDADEEALVVFEHVQDSIMGAPGDLAAVFLVDTATGETSELFSTFVAEAEDGTPTDIIDRFRVIGVADLNADGWLEVLVHTWYFEGAAVAVFEYDGDALVRVLFEGCGS